MTEATSLVFTTTGNIRTLATEISNGIKTGSGKVAAGTRGGACW